MQSTTALLVQSRIIPVKCALNITLEDVSQFIFSTTDYVTAANVSETQKASLYAELASGAESGWDYTMRWFHAGGLSSGLVSLNVRNTVAVDLNSLLCTYDGCGNGIKSGLAEFGIQTGTRFSSLLCTLLPTPRLLADILPLRRHSKPGFSILCGTVKRSETL